MEQDLVDQNRAISAEENLEAAARSYLNAARAARMQFDKIEREIRTELVEDGDPAGALYVIKGMIDEFRSVPLPDIYSQFFRLPQNGLHPRTSLLVRQLAIAMAQKLRRAEEKYGYSDGWAAANWEEKCRAKLMEHIAKGDPLDVAAYCAFMFFHGWSTSAEKVGRIQDADIDHGKEVKEGDIEELSPGEMVTGFKKQKFGRYEVALGLSSLDPSLYVIEIQEAEPGEAPVLFRTIYLKHRRVFGYRKEATALAWGLALEALIERRLS